MPTDRLFANKKCHKKETTKNKKPHKYKAINFTKGFFFTSFH